MIWPFKSRKTRRASRIDIKPPMPAAGRHGLALVVIAKDEQDYLHDWLTFHALAGVRHVFLYDNGSTDGTAEIARNFSGMKVTVIPWVLHTSTARFSMILPRQILAYCHAICTFGADFRWMGFIDIDEYLVPVDTKSILIALEPLIKYTNISLPWTMFGHSGHDKMPDISVPFAYREKAREKGGILLNFKCIVDPSDVTQVSTHRFRTNSFGAKSANMYGRLADNSQRKTNGFAVRKGLQLNHYYLRSKAELANKIAGSAVSGAGRVQRKSAVLAKAQLIEAGAVEDTTAPDFLGRHDIATNELFRSHFPSKKGGML